MAYQYSVWQNAKENKRKVKEFNIEDFSYNASLKRRQLRDSIRKKQAARTRFLILFFTVFGLLIPLIFINNLNEFLLKKFNNKEIQVPHEVSYLNSAEFAIADNTFLDTRYIDPVNTKNPLMNSPVLNGEMQILTRKLKNLIASYPRLKAGIFIWDYSTGKYVSINSNKIFSAASIIKLPLLYQLFRRVDQGLIDLEDSMSTEKPFITSGSGSLQYFSLGTTLTYRRLAELMVQESDNTASNMLLATVGGMNELNRTIKQWGFGVTHYSNWLPDLKGTNVTTPAEIGRMLYNIDNPDFLSLKSRAEMVEILGHVKNRYLIQANLPSNTQFLHKTGDIGSMLGDAGIVILPDGRKYIISIMVNRPWNSYSAKQFIIEASDTAYKSILKKRF